jgi:RNA polymerase sigma-70 factor (ECF subfamily)
MVPTDSDLVRRCLARDEEAFRVLVQRHERPVYSIIWRMVQNPEDARDLTQETFVKVFRALDQFELERNFGSWISKIASNAAIDFLRRKKMRTVSINVDPDDENLRPIELVDERPRADEELDTARVRERLDSLVERLPPHYRIVVTLRHTQQKSYEEITEILNLPMGTVKARLHRAHNQLRAWLAGDSEPGEWGG